MKGETKKKIINYSVLIFPLALIIGIPLDIHWLNRFGASIFLILIAWFIGMLRLRDLYLAEKKLTLDDIDSKEYKVNFSYWISFIVIQLLFVLPITWNLVLGRILFGIDWKKSTSDGAILFVTYLPTFVYIIRTFFNRTLRSEDAINSHNIRKVNLIENLKNNKVNFSLQHKEFFNDREVMMAAINQDAFNYIYASSFRFDKEMLMTAVSQALLGHHPKYIFESIEQSFLKDKDTLIEIVSRNYLFLKEIDLSSKSNLNNDLISAAVKNNPKALQFVPEIYKSDYDLILRLFDENKFLAPLMKEYGFLNSFDYSSLITKYNSRNLFSELAKKNGGILEYLPDGYRNDRLIVFEAFKKYNGSFEFASDLLKKDSDFIKELNKIAIESDFFNQIDISLRSNKQYILELLEQNPSIYKSEIKIAEHLYQDREFCIKLLEYGVVPLEILETLSWNDKSFVMEVYGRCSNIFFFDNLIDKELLKDRELLTVLLKKDGGIYKNTPDEFKNDREILLIAVKSNALESLRYASDELKNDKEIALEAIKNASFSVFYISENLINDKSFFIEAVKINGLLLEFGSDKGMIWDRVDGKIVKKYSLCKYKFNADKEIVLAALNQNIEAIEFVDESLLDDSDVVNVINNHIQKLNEG